MSFRLSVLAVVLGLLLCAAPAMAAGTPNIGLTADAPSRLLLGTTATVNLTAANPSGQPYGYNLSFRDLLPAGVSYVGGSASYEGAAVTPQVIVANAGLSSETTTLIWRNVGDLSPSSSGTLTYGVAHATTGLNAYSISGVRSSYAHSASAHLNTDPRTVPAFTGAGAYASGATGSDAKAATTNLTAVNITIQEDSPEGELLRGAHNHQTVYTLHLDNNQVATTGPLTVEAYLPAGLEFLACGQSDNTTSAPTNPGQNEEWPGAGSLSNRLSPAAPPAACDTPAEVATVTLDPDGAGPLPNALYTRVRWTNLPSLAPGAARDMRYVAAIPMRQNTATWTGATPPAVTLQQGANLDNNSGARTQDEQALPTYATVGGNYNAITPVSDDDTLTRIAEDLRVLKDASQDTITDGQLTRWTLTLNTGEYRYVDDIRVTDTVPDGLCPLASPALSPDADCAFVIGNAPNPPYTSTGENANGTWTLDWDSSTDAALTRMQPSAAHVIEFTTRARTHYQDNGSDQSPVLARDTWTNTVDPVLGADFQRCVAPADCGAFGVKLDTAPGLPAETDLDGTDDLDVSSASQAAGSPNIDKTIRTAGGATPVSCATGLPVDYTNGPAGPYGPGDRVCFTLRVNFPALLDTGQPTVTDFLPSDTEFESFVATGNSTVDILSVTRGPGGPATVAGDKVVTWTLGNGLEDSTTNGQVFEVRVAARITDTDAGTTYDITGNLMKFSHSNSDGESFPLRDLVNFTRAEAQLTLTEGVRDINGAPAGGNPANVDTGTVQSGDSVTIRVDVGNIGGRDAVGAEVWERLPILPASPTISCAAVTFISDSGACSAGVITWTGIDVPAGATRTRTYDYTIPAGVRPQTRFNHNAGVRTYESDDNDGGTFQYYPINNIDPAVTALQVNTTEADDPTHVDSATPTVTLTRSTVVNETGNNNAVATAQATIGERIDYTSTVTIPQGTTLSGTAATYTMPLGTRQTFVPGTLTAVFGVAPLPLGVTIAYDLTVPANPVIRLTFPDGYTNATDSGNDVFTIQFATTVDNEAQNTRVATGSATDIVQSGTFAFRDSIDTDETVTPSTPANQRTTQLVEPVISLSKDENDADDRVAPAQVIRYTLTLANSSAGRVSAAHDTLIVDTLPAGVTPVAADGILDDGDAIAPDNGTWSATARTITFTRTTLDPSGSAAFRYDVSVDDPQTGNAIKVNNAVAYTTSYVGGAAPAPGSERVGTFAAAPASPAGYRATATDTVRLIGATLTKGVDAATATIGQRRDYTLDVTMPAGLNFYDLTVRDLLPDGLDYEPASFAANCVGGCGLSATAIAPTANGDGSTQLGFFLGDVTASAQVRVLRVTYSAHVDDTYQPENTAVIRGQALQNTAVLHANQTNVIAGTPATVPAPGAFTDTGTNQQRTVTVTEPTLTIDKDVAGQAGDTDTRDAQPGDTLTYTVTVQNTGNADAHDVVVEDLPDTELVNVLPGAPPAGVTLVDGWTSGDRDLRWSVTTLPAGQIVTLTYTAELDVSTSLNEADTAANTADVPEYFAHPLAYRQANPGVDFRDYDDVTPDTVTVNVDLPRIEVDLTTGRAGFPESADAEVAQDFPWRATVRNTSPSAGAHDVDLTIRLPKNWTYTPGSSAGAGGEPVVTPDPNGDVLTWTDFSDVAAGANRVVTFDARPTLAAKTDAGLGAAHIAQASVTADDAAGADESADGPYADGPDPAQAILLAPDLAITKTPDNGSATAGTTATWTVTVANNGAGTARTVRVTDTIPAGVTYTPNSATSANGGFSELSATVNPDGSRTVVWTLGNLAPAASATISVPVAVAASDSAGATYVNSATVNAVEQPSGPTDTGSLNVITSADLRVVKTATPTAQNAGDLVSWTMTVTNNGPSDARDAVLSDVLPTDVTFVAFTQGAADCAHVTGTVTCTLGTLAPGDSEVVEVSTRLSPSLVAGAVTNTASVTGSAPDPTPANNTDDALVTVTALADLKVAKSVAPAAVAQNRDATYTLTVTNQGVSDASAAALTDTLPTGMTFVSLTQVSGPTASCATPAVGATGAITCTWASLAADAVATFILTAKAIDTGTLTNTATVTSEDPDPALADNTASADLTVEPTADMAIAKTGPATATAGGSATYTLTATNNGPSDANNVRVTDTLPAGLTFASATPDQGTCTEASGTVTCELGDIASGDAVTVELVTGVGFAAAEQTLTNTTSVRADEADNTPGDDSDSADTLVGPATDLRIEKTAAPVAVAQNQQATYTLAVTNDGPSDATGVTITDPLPAGVTFISASAGCAEASGTLTCVVGSLAADATVSVTITVRAVDNGTHPNTATVTGTEPDSDLANNSASADLDVGPTADLSVIKTGPGAVQAGGDVTYIISARNAGPSAATGVTVSDTLPAGMSYVSSAPSQGSCADASGVVTCQLGALAINATATVELTVRASFTLASQTPINTASIAGEQNDNDPSDDTSSHPVTVGPAADVSIVKSAPARVPAENQLVYTLQVANAGLQAATGVVVTDQLPDGLRLLDASSAQGTCTASERTVTCELGAMPAGGSAQITLLTEVAAGLAGKQLRNTATVTAAEPDPDPADNTGEAVTDVDLAVVTAGSLSVTKTAESAKVELGGTAAFTITVHNGTDRPATGVTVIDTPGSPVKVTGVQPDRGTCDLATLRCDLGQLAVGESVSIRVLMTPLRSGPLRNDATVSSDQGDRDAADNVASATLGISTAKTAFRLTKKATRKLVKAGSNAKFVIRAKNTGGHAAEDVRVCDTPGKALTFVRARGARLDRGRACWTVQYWPAGKAITFKVTAKVNRDVTGKALNRVRLTAGNTRALNRKASVRVKGGAARGGGVTG